MSPSCDFSTNSVIGGPASHLTTHLFSLLYLCNLFFFFESTPKAYLIFIEGRSLSTRTAPLATSNERNPTQRRLQTKQPQHKEPVLSNKPSHVLTGAKHLRRGTAPKGTSLSTHHPKEINGGTWTDPRSSPPEHASKACIVP
jgi:hypothetical protein